MVLSNCMVCRHAFQEVRLLEAYYLHKTRATSNVVQGTLIALEDWRGIHTAPHHPLGHTKLIKHKTRVA